MEKKTVFSRLQRELEFREKNEQEDSPILLTEQRTKSDYEKPVPCRPIHKLGEAVSVPDMRGDVNAEMLAPRRRDEIKPAALKSETHKSILRIQLDGIKRSNRTLTTLRMAEHGQKNFSSLVKNHHSSLVGASTEMLIQILKSHGNQGQKMGQRVESDDQLTRRLDASFTIKGEQSEVDMEIEGDTEWNPTKNKFTRAGTPLKIERELPKQITHMELIQEYIRSLTTDRILLRNDKESCISDRRRMVELQFRTRLGQNMKRLKKEIFSTEDEIKSTRRKKEDLEAALKNHLNIDSAYRDLMADVFVLMKNIERET